MKIIIVQRGRKLDQVSMQHWQTGDLIIKENDDTMGLTVVKDRYGTLVNEPAEFIRIPRLDNDKVKEAQ